MKIGEKEPCTYRGRKVVQPHAVKRPSRCACPGRQATATHLASDLGNDLLLLLVIDDRVGQERSNGGVGLHVGGEGLGIVVHGLEGCFSKAAEAAGSTDASERNQNTAKVSGCIYRQPGSSRRRFSIPRGCTAARRNGRQPAGAGGAGCPGTGTHHQRPWRSRRAQRRSRQTPGQHPAAERRVSTAACWNRCRRAARWTGQGQALCLLNDANLHGDDSANAAAAGGDGRGERLGVAEEGSARGSARVGGTAAHDHRPGSSNVGNHLCLCECSD